MRTVRLERGALLILLLGCAANAAEKPGGKDRRGDPLPAGAIARLGTVRLRHTHRTSDAVFTADGNTVLVSDCGGNIVFWDVASAREVGRLHAEDSEVNVLPLALTADGKTLAAGGLGRFA